MCTEIFDLIDLQFKELTKMCFVKNVSLLNLKKKRLIIPNAEKLINYKLIESFRPDNW